ncbi:MAG: ABC transporter permease [Anaerovoracaceae bacterium]
MKKTRSYIISFAVLVILWELLAVSGLFPESLFPSPVRTAEALGRRISSGALLLDIGASMYRFFIGYITSVIAAVILGLLLGWFAKAWRYVDPVVQFLRPISPVAWLPFIVLWVGIGDVPAIVIIFIAAFFPVLLTTVTAVGNIDPVYLKISDNFGLGRAQTLLGIVFPAIFPQIANALHIAAGTAWIFLVVGEMAGSQSGLGYLITDARNNLQTDTLMAAIISIGIIGIVLDLLIRHAQQHVERIWGFSRSEEK